MASLADIHQKFRAYSLRVALWLAPVVWKALTQPAPDYMWYHVYASEVSRRPNPPSGFFSVVSFPWSKSPSTSRGVSSKPGFVVMSGANQFL